MFVNNSFKGQHYLQLSMKKRSLHLTKSLVLPKVNLFEKNPNTVNCFGVLFLLHITVI